MVINTGVYTITNKVNKKLYVGSTTKTFNKRWSDHKSSLRNNKHSNVHLQRAWNKYGKENFLFEILDRCEVEFCLSTEQYWINMLGVYKMGYNRSPTAKNSKGSVRSEEILIKMRKLTNYKKANAVWKGQHHSIETRKILSAKAKMESQDRLHTQEIWDKISIAHKKRNKKLRANNTYESPRKGTGKYGKCEQYDMNWVLLKVFNNPYEAYKELNLRNASHIIRASNKKTRHCCNFRWKVYTKEGTVIE